MKKPLSSKTSRAADAKALTASEIGDLVNRWENPERPTLEFETRLTIALLKAGPQEPKDVIDLETSDLFQDIMREAEEWEVSQNKYTVASNDSECCDNS